MALEGRAHSFVLPGWRHSHKSCRCVDQRCNVDTPVGQIHSMRLVRGA
jgi:hypothetical protein